MHTYKHDDKDNRQALYSTYCMIFLEKIIRKDAIVQYIHHYTLVAIFLHNSVILLNRRHI